ncbi:MAG: protein-L-isoaspartate(D-aspartate) O-methyltransferase [Acidimicrobiia bacterium]
MDAWQRTPGWSRLAFPISLATLLVLACSTTGTQTAATLTNGPIPDEWATLRTDMVEDQIAARGVSDPLVLEAMLATPRHLFVPDEYRSQAYDDHPLPIGHGQTISQPYIVALMSQELGVEPGDKVLEIGTGSGYQAAVLAEMGMRVYTIEIVPQLASRAADTLRDTGYEEVEARQGDGYWGWPEQAPFNAIIVTAAPDHLPQPLMDQLSETGALVIPIGPIGAVQTLWRFIKDEALEVVGENLGPVRFVPLTRAEG